MEWTSHDLSHSSNVVILALSLCMTKYNDVNITITEISITEINFLFIFPWKNRLLDC